MKELWWVSYYYPQLCQGKSFIKGLFLSGPAETETSWLMNISSYDALMKGRWNNRLCEEHNTSVVRVMEKTKYLPSRSF